MNMFMVDHLVAHLPKTSIDQLEIEYQNSLYWEREEMHIIYVKNITSHFVLSSMGYAIKDNYEDNLTMF